MMHLQHFRCLKIPLLLLFVAGLPACSDQVEPGPVKPLHQAAFNGNAEEVRRLLSNGADVNAGEPNGRTPLHLAAMESETEVVRLLVAKGANVNARVAAVEGAEAITGFTPLHFAAYWGADDVARLLVAKGANVNARNKDGATPLHGAAYGGNLEIARLLVAKGADVNAKGAGVQSSNRAGFVLRYKRTFLMISRVAGRTPLHQAAFNGHTEVARLLLDEGAAVDPKDAEGYTPLHQAASGYSSAEVARLLVDEGADVDARDVDRRTPLHVRRSTAESR